MARVVEHVEGRWKTCPVSRERVRVVVGIGVYYGGLYGRVNRVQCFSVDPSGRCMLENNGGHQWPDCSLLNEAVVFED